ncbi:MAG: hypothetical protein JNL11_02500 [Bdellovibrionaceae bacterium]|nr:hypothetical protein [Pseudobdellovibrionaceae bacterium]
MKNDISKISVDAVNDARSNFYNAFYGKNERESLAHTVLPSGLDFNEYVKQTPLFIGASRDKSTVIALKPSYDGDIYIPLHIYKNLDISREAYEKLSNSQQEALLDEKLARVKKTISDFTQSNGLVFLDINGGYKPFVMKDPNSSIVFIALTTTIMKQEANSSFTQAAAEMMDALIDRFLKP